MKNNFNSHSKIYWYNPTNKHYYIVRITYDLFGDLILIKEWGGTTSKGGRVVNMYFPSRKLAANHLKEINARRKNRGYTRPKILTNHIY